jgi:hypothetical protein
VTLKMRENALMASTEAPMMPTRNVRGLETLRFTGFDMINQNFRGSEAPNPCASETKPPVWQTTTQ